MAQIKTSKRAVKAVYSAGKAFAQKVSQNIKSWHQRNFKDTGKPLAPFTDVVTGILLALMLSDSGLPKLPGIILAFLAALLLLNLLRLVLLPVLKAAQKISARNIYYFVQIFAVLSYLWDISLNSGGNTTYTPSIILALILAGSFLFFIRSFYAFFLLHRKSPTLFLTLVLSFLLTVGGGYFVLGSGLPYNYVKAYLSLQTEKIRTEDIKEVPLGPLKTASIDYGTNSKILKSRTTNLSNYVVYEGFTKKIRDFYWGYSIDKVPLKGRIWYPKEGGSYPVMFIVHGNHTMTTPSYLGYAYLGEYLASYGYVVVSVDESFLNGYIDDGLSGENDARAILLLENMKMVQKFVNTEGTPLYGKMDFDNLTLAGHSRGGEAITVAALYNSLERLPDNGNLHLSYDFHIKSLIAIAPCADQYRPSGRDVELSDVNYLLIHGANDQDVSYMMGEKQYQNISFTGEGDYFKAYLYIADANHGQFNSKWGRFDLSTPFNMMLNTKNLIPKKTQQNTLKIAVKKFLDATTAQDTGARDFFQDYEQLREALPINLYLNGYEDNTMKKICTYEEDTDLTTGTLDNVTLSSYGTSYWYETMVYYELNGPDRDNHAFSCAWNNSSTAFYDLLFNTPSADNGEYLQFNVTDDREFQTKKKNMELLDFTVRLTDSEGNMASVALADYATVFPALPVITTKLQFLTDSPVYKHYFQTVRIPLQAFTQANQEIDITSIKSIRFLFDKLDTGKIKLDDIGFSN